LRGYKTFSDWNTTMFQIAMLPDDPNYEFKWKMLDFKEEPKAAPAIDLRINNQANDIYFFRTISWLRWVHFSGDINDLNAHKLKA
jgi:hypothetical protein